MENKCSSHHDCSVTDIGVLSTASGNEITGAKSYTLGQPMYFEAKQPDGTARSGDQRIYFKKCFITASQDSNSNPKYAVIDNHG